MAALLLGLPGPRLLHAAEPPHVVALVLDTSGSLAPADLARARTLALGVLEGLEPGSQVAVFTFDDESRLLLPRTSSTGEVRRALESAARTGRYTALHDALYDASRYLRDAPGARKAIVLLTDGRDENSALNLDDGLKVAQDAGMPVFAVGLGQTEERVLRRIAKLTAGEYLRGAQARPEALAQKIRAAPAPAPPPSTASAARSAPPSRRAAVPAAAAERSQAPGRGNGPWMAAAALMLAAAAGLVLLLRRRRPAAATPAPAGPDVTFRAGLAPTLLTRLHLPEDTLDKTITLREQPVLMVTRGPGQGQRYELNQVSATSLGRARANDVVLPDVAVSSPHCRIRPEEGRYVLHDLESTNGTFVNDKRVDRHALSEGDVVQIGETALEFRTEHRRE
jgi:hypothetical protein